MGGINARSNWITNRAIAMKHLFAVCETAGKTELSLLCCNVWLSPRGNPKPRPLVPMGERRRLHREPMLRELPQPARSERHRQRQGWNICLTWLRGDPCSQLLFICMLVLKLVGIFHRSYVMTKPWNIVVWWHQSSEIRLLAIAVQMICAFHYSNMIIKPESGEGKWQKKADACQ